MIANHTASPSTHYIAHEIYKTHLVVNLDSITITNQPAKNVSFCELPKIDHVYFQWLLITIHYYKRHQTLFTIINHYCQRNHSLSIVFLVTKQNMSWLFSSIFTISTITDHYYSLSNDYHYYYQLPLLSLLQITISTIMVISK